MKFQKIISLLLACVMVFGCAASLTSCLSESYPSGSIADLIPVNEDPKCAHVYESETIYEVTKMTDGIIRHTCTLCGESYLEFVPAERPINEAKTLFELLAFYIPDFNYSFNLQKGTVVNLGPVDAVVNKADVHLVSRDGRPAAVIDLDVNLPTDEEPYTVNLVGKLYFNGDDFYFYIKEGEDVLEELHLSITDTIFGFLQAYLGIGIDAESVLYIVKELDGLSTKVGSVLRYVVKEQEAFKLLLFGLLEAIRYPSVDLSSFITVTRDDTTGNTEYVFNEAGVSALLSYFGEKSIADLIDDAYDDPNAPEGTEHFSETLLNFIHDVPALTINQIVDYIVTFSEKTGVDGEQLFEMVDAIGNIVINNEFSIDTLLYEAGDVKICTLLGYNPVGEQTYAQWVEEEWEPGYFSTVEAILGITVSQLIDEGLSLLGLEMSFDNLVGMAQDYEGLVKGFVMVVDADENVISLAIDGVDVTDDPNYAVDFDYSVEDGYSFILTDKTEDNEYEKYNVTLDAENHLTFVEKAYLDLTGTATDLAYVKFLADVQPGGEFDLQLNDCYRFDDTDVYELLTLWEAAYTEADGFTLVCNKFFPAVSGNTGTVYQLVDVAITDDNLSVMATTTDMTENFCLLASETGLFCGGYQTVEVGGDDVWMTAFELAMSGERVPATAPDAEDGVVIHEARLEVNDYDDLVRVGSEEATKGIVPKILLTYDGTDATLTGTVYEQIAEYEKATETHTYVTLPKYTVTTEVEDDLNTYVIGFYDNETDFDADDNIVISTFYQYEVRLSDGKIDIKRFDVFMTEGRRDGTFISVQPIIELATETAVREELVLTANSIDYASYKRMIVKETEYNRKKKGEEAASYMLFVYEILPQTEFHWAMKDGWFDALEAAFDTYETGTEAQWEKTITLAKDCLDVLDNAKFALNTTSVTRYDAARRLDTEWDDQDADRIYTFTPVANLYVGYDRDNGLTFRESNEIDTVDIARYGQTLTVIQNNEKGLMYWIGADPYNYQELTVGKDLSFDYTERDSYVTFKFNEKNDDYFKPLESFTYTNAVYDRVHVTRDGDTGVISVNVWAMRRDVSDDSDDNVQHGTPCDCGTITYTPGHSVKGMIAIPDNFSENDYYASYGKGVILDLNFEKNAEGKYRLLDSVVGRVQSWGISTHRVTMDYDSKIFSLAYDSYDYTFGMTYEEALIPVDSTRFKVTLDLNVISLTVDVGFNGVNHDGADNPETYGVISFIKTDNGWVLNLKDSFVIYELLYYTLELLGDQKMVEPGDLLSQDADGFYSNYGIRYEKDEATGEGKIELYLHLVDFLLSVEAAAGADEHGYLMGNKVDDYYLDVFFNDSTIRVCTVNPEGKTTDLFDAYYVFDEETNTYRLALGESIDEITIPWFQYVPEEDDDFHIETLFKTFEIGPLSINLCAEPAGDDYRVQIVTPFFNGSALFGENADGQTLLLDLTELLGMNVMLTKLTAGGYKAEAYAAGDGEYGAEQVAEAWLTWDNGHVSIRAYYPGIVDIATGFVLDLECEEPIANYEDVFGTFEFDDE